jgi:DMSO/TMAO reductase YedYZ molybdopterin-dependent catalytic subunit
MILRKQNHLTQIRRLERRLFLRRGLSMGALTMLTGCDLSTHDGVFDRMLWAMLRFNDRVQEALFDPNRLAATFRPDQITHPFKFNAYYPLSQVKAPDPDWQLEVAGQVTDKTPWSLEKLRALPQKSQITRHICVEGWSQIGQWSGVPLKLFLQRIGADLRARYVAFDCYDDYSSSIDMASALHPQTILALDFLGAPLTPAWGAPVRLRIPVKLGFKNPKNITTITVTNEYPGGYWEDQGYDWFSGS